MTTRRMVAGLFAISHFMIIEGARAGWEKLAPLPEENGGFAAAADTDGITVVGGTRWENGVKLWLRGISRFDFKTERWRTIGKLKEPVGYGLCGVTRDGKHILLGGSSGTAPVKAFAVIDAEKTMPQPAPTLPDQIVISAGGIVGNQFIVVGGTNDAANIAGFTNRTFSFDLVKHAVTPLPEFPGRPFSTAASVVVGGELFIFGGANWAGKDQTVVNTAAAHAFDVTKQSWRKLEPYPLVARGITALALDDRRIYLAGGYAGSPETFRADAFIYDIREDSYSAATPLPYAAMAGLIRTKDFVFCLGGEDEKQHRTDAFWRIRLGEMIRVPKNGKK